MVNRYLEMSTAHLKEETIGMLKDMDIPYCVNYEEVKCYTNVVTVVANKI